MNRIVVIAVHPDDETLGCGGTLLKHKANGDEVYWLILTKANQKITNIKGIESEQLRYIREVAAAYDFNNWKQLTFLTTELDNYPMVEIVVGISQYINELKPNIIFFASLWRYSFGSSCSLFGNNELH